MKTNASINKMPTCLMAVVLMAIGTTTTALAAPPALNGKVTLRPFTATDRTTYAMPTAQISGGLNNVGLGEPVYLDALVNSAIAPSSLVGSVTWTLTSKPLGSLAALATSPLGANVDIYLPSDKYGLGLTAYAAGTVAAQVAGRSFLQPDVVGIYTVVTKIAVAGSGTNSFTNTISAATYVGIQTCTFCHSGSVIAPDIYHTFTNTPHASFFARAIDGGATSHYSQNCIYCHTVGYDANTNAVNGGFDDVAAQLGWTFPSVLTNGNWASMQTNYPALANLANIQCENCHGPGSQHVFSLGVLGNTNAISVSLAEGTCGQCHDAKNNHIKSFEWKGSLHSRPSATPTGSSRPQCVRCHAAAGFIGWATAGGMTALNKYPTNIIWANSRTTNIVAYSGIAPAYTIPATPPDTAYGAIDCQTCHDPHDASNPRQLRLGTSVTLSDGTVVTNAGTGGFCMECHNSRGGSYTNMLAQYPLSQVTWAGGSAFGTHDSPQADILEGVNAETYGKVIPSSAHRFAITNTCAGCHMQTVATTDPAFGQAGGHTFHMSYTQVSGGVTNTVDKVDVCVQCHGPMTSFDLVKVDYDGDGVIEGVQTEVQHLLDKLSKLLPPRSGYQANPNNYVADGLVKASDSQMAIYTNVPTKFLKAYYNWDIVFRDSSLGIHNAQFVVGLLKASIGDLTGDNNNDGLSDAWQIQYFGSATAPNAAPNASPAGDGVPNWLKYSLGLNPLSPWGSIPGGFVWGPTIPVGFVSGPTLTNPQGTNAIQIFTAAEVAFNTQVGTTYQIQSSPSVNGNFANLGGAIAGTGGSISYVTPTRGTTNMFFRVVHTP
jgi:hypothetical protein